MAARPVPLRGITSGEFGVLLINVMLPEKLPADWGANPTLNVKEPPAITERGIASPEELYPVPEREACDTVSVAVPALRIVSVCVLVTPVLTLPKLTLAGITEICGCTPVPVKEIVDGELVALLTTVILPAAVPAAAGAKFAVTERP